MKYAFTLLLMLVTLLAICTQGIAAGNDEQAIRDVVDAFQQYWNRHDMEGLAGLFSEDADFVNVRGTRWLGRSAIQEAHTKSHSRQFKNSVLTIKETSVRFLNPDIVVTRSLWDLVGHTTPTGEVGEPRKGILTNIVVRRNNKWEIVVTQNTDVVPAQ